jgi:DNA-binding response OmpR family regulator
MALFRRKKRCIRRLLIVEDEPLVAFDNERLLEKSGYEIAATVDSGEAAIALIGRELVDAVILDVQLAGERSGIDVAKVAAGRGVAVLFVSGQCPPEAQMLGMGVLAKPYLEHELLASLTIIDQLMQGERVDAVPPGLTLFDNGLLRPAGHAA